MSSQLPHFAVIATYVLCLINRAAGLAPTKAEVDFQDPNLMRIVLTAIGKDSPPLHAEDLLDVTNLDATDQGICRLDGLEACTALTELKLGKNRISDVRPLEGLTQLTRLELYQNYVRNIDHLTHLTNLVELDLHRNFITDVNALANLSKLEVLNLDENWVRNLQPLRNLDSLTELRLHMNWIRDVSALTANRGLDAGDTIDVTNNLLTENTYQYDVPEMEGRLGYRICEPHDPNKGDSHVLDFPVSWAQGRPYTVDMPINDSGVQGGWSCGQVAHSMILYYWSLQNAVCPTSTYWYYREDNARPIGADFSQPFAWEDMLPCITGLDETDPRVASVADLAYRFTIATRTDWWPKEHEDHKGLKYKEAVVKYFGFDPSKYVEDVKVCELDDWDLYERVNSEIDAGRPCELHIADVNGGEHEVVLTGYRWISDHYEYAIHFGYRDYGPLGASRYDPSQFYSLRQKIGEYDKTDSFQITLGIGPHQNKANIPTYNKLSETAGALVAGYNKAEIVWNGQDYAAVIPIGNSEQRGLAFQRISASGLPIGEMVPLADFLPNNPGASLCWNGSGYAAVWDGSSEGESYLVVALLTETGTEISDARLSDIDPGSEVKPSIAWNAYHGEYGLTFRDSEQDIRFVRLSEDGTLLDASAVKLGRKRHPDILWTGGLYAVSWAYQQKVLLELRAGDGSPLGKSEFLLPLSNECRESTVAYDGEGFGVAWIEKRDGGHYVVRFCRAAADGQFLPDTAVMISDMVTVHSNSGPHEPVQWACTH